MKLQEMMTSREASDYLGISNDYFRKLVNKRRIKAAVVGNDRGRRLYFEQSWLDDYIARRTKVIEPEIEIVEPETETE